jgi:tetratricopeptide (TPR) repeat protein
LANFQSEREQLAQLEWLFEQKKYSEGLARTEAVLREFPASFQIKFLRYKFLRELQQNVEAMQLLRQLHAMSGDNIMVVKALAELCFQQKQFGESLLYYKKLLFLDSFNSQAQERLKLLQGMLEAGISDRLADTKAEFRIEVPVAAAPPQPAAPAPIEIVLPMVGEAPPPISFTAEEEAAVPAVIAAIEIELPMVGEAPPPISFTAEEEAAAPTVTDTPAAPEAGLHFQTESAAELYFKQGLYKEALSIYKNLFEKTGRTDHFLKIKAILQLLRADRNNRIIERLQCFLQLLQQRGKQIV